MYICVCVLHLGGSLCACVCKYEERIRALVDDTSTVWCGCGFGERVGMIVCLCGADEYMCACVCSTCRHYERSWVVLDDTSAVCVRVWRFDVHTVCVCVCGVHTVCVRGANGDLWARVVITSAQGLC